MIDSSAHPRNLGGGRPNGTWKRWESADKPGSVVDSHSSGMPVTGHLKQPTRKHARAVRCRSDESVCSFPYLALLRAGFAMPFLLPGPRCALTAPVHPAQQHPRLPLRRFILWCTFRGLSPPRRYLALCPAEPGLSSRTFRYERLPSQLPRAH